MARRPSRSCTNVPSGQRRSCSAHSASTVRGFDARSAALIRATNASSARASAASSAGAMPAPAESCATALELGDALSLALDRSRTDAGCTAASSARRRASVGGGAGGGAGTDSETFAAVDCARERGATGRAGEAPCERSAAGGAGAKCVVPAASRAATSGTRAGCAGFAPGALVCVAVELVVACGCESPARMNANAPAVTHATPSPTFTRLTSAAWRAPVAASPGSASPPNDEAPEAAASLCASALRTRARSAAVGACVPRAS